MSDSETLTRRSRTGRRAALFAGAGAIGVGFVALAASPALPDWGRDMLRHVVTACVLDKRTAGAAFPCAEVHLGTASAIGYVRIRPPGGYESLIVPIDPMPGIESPELLTEAATPLWAAAWSARGAVARALGHDIGRNTVALAVNAKGTRTQDQFHIHVDCLGSSIGNAIEKRIEELSESWAPYPGRLRGERYWARTIHSPDLAGVNVVRLIAEGLPGAAGNMESVTLAVAPSILKDGAPGFVLLANTSDRSAERLLDHTCEGL